MAIDQSISAPVFNIQTYCIHDGPGIRDTVFVKGCPLRCAWCANPESQAGYPELMTYAGKCVGCGKCIPACPQSAIRMGDQEGKPVALTDRTRCTNCGACEQLCPVDARELVGKRKTVQEALDKVLGDKLFLEMSGGGITVSGGEPLAHPDFTEALLAAAKEAGLHTAMETCSYASRQTVDRVYAHVDLGLCDIKHMDSKEHERLVGVPNQLILENIRHIHKDLGVPIIIRVPTIPGFNDSDAHMHALGRFVSEELGPEVPVNLLPYHRLGEGKRENLGREALFTADVPSDDHMQHLCGIIASYGLQVKIGG